jgi:hypothetical protein
MKFLPFVLLVSLAQIVLAEDDILGMLDKKAAALPTATPTARATPPPAEPSRIELPEPIQPQSQQRRGITAESVTAKMRAEGFDPICFPNPAIDWTEEKLVELYNLGSQYMQAKREEKAAQQSINSSTSSSSPHPTWDKIVAQARQAAKKAPKQSTGDKVLNVGSVLAGNFSMWLGSNGPKEVMVEGTPFTEYQATPQGRPFRSYLIPGRPADLRGKTFTKGLYLKKYVAWAVLMPLDLR